VDYLLKQEREGRENLHQSFKKGGGGGGGGAVSVFFDNPRRKLCGFPVRRKRRNAWQREKWREGEKSDKGFPDSCKGGFTSVEDIEGSNASRGEKVHFPLIRPGRKLSSFKKEKKRTFPSHLIRGRGEGEQRNERNFVEKGKAHSRHRAFKEVGGGPYRVLISQEKRRKASTAC